ncbi:MAG: hypothetical protein V4467_04380 [Patescibacteria group bacterium]
MNNNTQPAKVVSGGQAAPSNTGLYIVAVLIIGLIVGFFIGSYWQSHVKKAATADTQTETEDQPVDQAADETGSGVTTNTPSDNMVSVADQAATTLVRVDSVSLTEPAWVAVREDNSGALGKILGAQRFDAGTYTNVVISLLRSTEVGKTYHIVLYRDDGTKVFNYSAAGFIPGLSEEFTVFAAK